MCCRHPIGMDLHANVCWCPLVTEWEYGETLRAEQGAKKQSVHGSRASGGTERSSNILELPVRAEPVEAGTLRRTQDRPVEPHQSDCSAACQA